MAYPTEIDNLINVTGTQTLADAGHAQRHNDANAAFDSVRDYLDAQFPLKADLTQLGGRNLLYNGAMQVAQRSASVASIVTGGYYTADRWTSEINSLGTWTQSVENDAPTGSGFRKSLKMLCTTADASPGANDLLDVMQIIEGQDLQRIAKGTASAQQLSLSFWVKSNVTGTYTVLLYDQDNTRSVAAAYTVSASATWERKAITLPADTTGAFDNDNAGSLLVLFQLGAGSDFTSGALNTTWASYVAANRAVGQTNLAASTNNYWQVTGVQLEVGPAATPFEFKSFAQEVRECQRYFEKSFPINTAPGHNLGGEPFLPYMGSFGCGGNSYTVVRFSVPKRAVNGTLRLFDPSNARTFTENWVMTFAGCAGTPQQVTALLISVFEGYMAGYVQGAGTGAFMSGNWTVECEL